MMCTLQEIRIWIIGFLIIPISFAQRPIELPSRLISYTLCPTCSNCTGLFLNNKTILTAAHCAERNSLVLPNPSVPPWGKFQGLVLATKNVWKTKRYHMVNDYVLTPHSQYNKQTRFNDLMIIKLKKEIKLPKALFPISFATDNSLQGVFWGKGFGGGNGYRILREGREIPLKLATTVESRLVFFHEGKTATCFGDSGGPTYIQRTNGSVELVSIISGFARPKGVKPSSAPCPLEYVSFHTLLYPHLEWIKNLME